MLYLSLTFDDGFPEHYKIAKILYKLGIKATFFPVACTNKFSDTLISKPELINEIASLGHEIGSHTCSHPNLAILPRDKVKEELSLSKKILEDITGREVLTLAYPYGIYNSKVIVIASKYYLAARGGYMYPWEDPLNLNIMNPYILAGIGPHIRAFIKRSIKYRYINKILKLININRIYSLQSTPWIILVFHNDFFKYINILLKIKEINSIKIITIKDFIDKIYNH